MTFSLKAHLCFISIFFLLSIPYLDTFHMFLESRIAKIVLLKSITMVLSKSITSIIEFGNAYIKIMHRLIVDDPKSITGIAEINNMYSEIERGEGGSDGEKRGR